MSKALKTYRGLVRAINLAFENDATTRLAALHKIREEYTREPAPEGAELTQKLQLARDSAHILRKNVVQGERLAPDQPYRLRLHKESELGDNDDRFKPTGASSSNSSGCCGGAQK